MEIVKIIGIGIITCIASVLIKQVQPEISILVVLAGSILILLSIISGLKNSIDGFGKITNMLNIDNAMLTTILKILGIGYLVEFGASICNDSGHSAIAEKIVLAGKVSILIMCFPIVNNLVQILVELLL